MSISSHSQCCDGSDLCVVVADLLHVFRHQQASWPSLDDCNTNAQRHPNIYHLSGQFFVVACLLVSFIIRSFVALSAVYCLDWFLIGFLCYVLGFRFGAFKCPSVHPHPFSISRWRLVLLVFLRACLPFLKRFVSLFWVDFFDRFAF